MPFRNQPDQILESALTALEAGIATIEEIRQANSWRLIHRPQLGKLAMTHGKLSMAQVFEILSEQAITGELFGQTAVRLGLMDHGNLFELLQVQNALTPTLADALITLNIITPNQAIAVLKKVFAKKANITDEPMLLESVTS